MSNDIKLIAEAYEKVVEGFLDPYEIMNNIVGAITAGSTMYGGAVSPDANALNEKTITKIVHYVENGNLNKKMLFKTLARARRENNRAFTVLINFAEKGSYNSGVKNSFIKNVLPLAKKVLSADIDELRELEADQDTNDYLLNRVEGRK